MAARNNDWKSRLGVVYSTNPDYAYATDTPREETQTLPLGAQRLAVSLDRHGRGGKQVTLVEGFVGSEDSLRELGRMLKARLGVGGAVKEGGILIQGDFRERVAELLREAGYTVKRKG